MLAHGFLWGAQQAELLASVSSRGKVFRDRLRLLSLRLRLARQNSLVYSLQSTRPVLLFL